MKVSDGLSEELASAILDAKKQIELVAEEQAAKAEEEEEVVKTEEELVQINNKIEELSALIRLIQAIIEQEAHALGM